MKRLGDLKTLSAYILILTAFSFINGCVSMTPLSTAAKRGDINAVKELLNQGADVNEKTILAILP